MMAPRWSQDYLRETPELASRVGEVQFLQNRLCRRRSSLREGPRRPKVALRGPKMSKNGPKTAQDGPKMAPRRFQDDAKTDKMALSCRRGANFAKSAMHRLSSEVVTLKWRKIDPRGLRDGRYARDGPEMAEDGPKMVPIGASRRPQNGALV